MNRKLFYLFFIFSLSFDMSKENLMNEDGEREALIDLYNSLDGIKWTRCNWTDQINKNNFSICDGLCGVHCDDSFHIISLLLNQNNLKGNLRSTLSNLTHLQRLDLSFNQM